MAHTKGPWKVANYCFYESQYADKEFCITAPKRGRIAKASKLSDAELISRAPEMSAEIEQLKKQRDELIDALKAIASLEGSESNEWDAVERIIPEMCEIARAAIAKSTSK